MSKNILFFYQNSEDTIFLRSIIDLYSISNKVHLITLSPRGFLHNHYKNTEIAVVSINNLKSFFSIFIYLIIYCYKHNIEFVFSHLQRANLIAVIAQFFIKAKVYPTRHHIDDVRILKNRNSIIQDRLVNFFSKRIIVLSETAKLDLINNEHVDPNKILVVPLAYNFDLYFDNNPELLKKTNIVESNKILIVGRLVDNKRTFIAIELLKKIIELEYHYTLFILGDGPCLNNLKELVSLYKLDKFVVFTGNVSNVLEHISSSKYILLPSISESSNQVIKEAGLLSKPVIVCDGVGDFDEYLKNNINAFVVSKNNFIVQAKDIIIASDKKKLYEIGEKLKKTIMKKFSILNYKKNYINLISKS